MADEYPKLMKITIGTHYFKITNMQPRMIGVVQKFCVKYVQMEYQNSRGKRVLAPGKVYATRTKDNSEYRFHIGQYPEFIQHLYHNDVEIALCDIIKRDLIDSPDIDIDLNKGWVLRDDQNAVKDFILQSEETDLHTRMATLYTGFGKTVVALASAADINKRVLVTVLSKYQDKWASDVVKTLNIKPKEVMVISGSHNVRGLIALAQSGQLEAKCIIISINTLNNYLKAYEDDPHTTTNDDFGCAPENFCELLGIGTMIVDEVHEHIHAVFKMLLYTHVYKVIALSGTLISLDPFIQKIHSLMFPKEVRYDKAVMNKYIKCYAIGYSVISVPVSKIRTTQFGSNLYSHNAFEKYILKHKPLLDNYLKIIDNIIELGYIQNYKDGNKLGVYASSIDMCSTITHHLKKKYPDLDVRRYVEQDPYENAIEADIRVTTILSAGTAFDIPMLTDVIMTNSIKSPVSNLQTLGRLRELKDRDVRFYYLYCEQIPKHVEYHKAKKELFEPKVISTKDYKSPISL